MTDDPHDKLREAHRLLEEAQADFSKAHVKGMESFTAPTSQKQIERLGEAIKQERQAIEKAAKGIELQREALAEQRNRLEKAKETGDF
jgi:flagellar biosynthesis chaperone FliJ